MTLRHALAPIVFAFAMFAPPAAGAQTTSPAQPDQTLAALTNRYFDAIAHGDVGTMLRETSSTFHVIEPDGRRLSSDTFLLDVSKLYLTTLPPMGNSSKIRATTVTDGHATVTVDTQRWYYGVADPEDPMSAPKTELDLATHQLSWSRSENGTWQLDEDHIVSADYT